MSGPLPALVFLLAVSAVPISAVPVPKPGAGGRSVLTEYKADRLRVLAAEGGLVLVQFHSESCEVCLMQEEALSRLLADDEPGLPAVLQADFDTDEELRLFYRVTAPSTLLLFKGEEILARKTGVQTAAEIRAFLRETVSRLRGRPGPRPKQTLRPKR